MRTFLTATLFSITVPLALAAESNPLTACEGANSPSIEILKVDKTGDYYSEDFRITGKIRGRCLNHASLFQNGEKVLDIPVTPSDQGTEQEFRITVDASHEPEIRVSSSGGTSEVLPIDVLDYRG
jgi:hypothetical protein